MTSTKRELIDSIKVLRNSLDTLTPDKVKGVLDALVIDLEELIKESPMCSPRYCQDCGTFLQDGYCHRCEEAKKPCSK